MKKLYVTIIAALLGSSSLAARELVFYMGTTPIADKENVQFKDIEISSIGGGRSEVSMEPQLYLFTDIVTSSVKISANCISGQTISMCAGGSCGVPNTSIVKENISIASNQKLPLEFHYEGILEAGQEAPQVVTEFEAVDTRRPETLKSFTLVMNPQSGVATVIGTNNSFRAVSGGIEYSFDAPTAVEIFNTAGRKMLSDTFSGSGTLSTSGLDAGVYIYSLNGVSGKIYIR